MGSEMCIRDRYDRLGRMFEETGGRVVVDSAFAQGEYPFLMKSAQDYVGSSSNGGELIRFRQATGVRQSAEWGMRGLQGSFPRMKERFFYEECGERKIVLTSVTLLYNFRAVKVGMNQIQSTFMPHMSCEADQFIYHTLTSSTFS